MTIRNNVVATTLTLLISVALLSVSVASPSFDDRVLRKEPSGDLVLGQADFSRAQRKPSGAIQQPAPQYYGYYGPIARTSVRPKPVLFGVGGWW